MRLTLLRRTLKEDRRALIGWSIGIAAFICVYLPFYAQMREGAAQGIEALMEGLPEGLRTAMGWQDLFTATGFLEAMVYQIYEPILLIAFAAVLGNRAIAVPEESGRLDQLLSLPISRRSFVLQRFAALLGQVVLASAVVWAVVMAFVTGLDMGIGIAPVTAATVGLLLLALCFGTLTLTVGALTGRRTVALAVTGGAAVASYAARVLSQAGVEAAEPLRWISPFHYYLGGDPLREEFPLAYYGVLVGIVAVLAAVAVVGFERRDVAV